VHGPVPLHPPPLQPLKMLPVVGVAVSVTAVPFGSLVEHALPQLIPAGALTIVPRLRPETLTDRLTMVTGFGANVAVTLFEALNVTVQLPVPLHAPDQPEKIELASGVAVSVIAVPLG